MEFYSGHRTNAILLSIIFLPAMYGWFHVWWVFAVIYVMIFATYMIINWSDIANPKPKGQRRSPLGR